MKETNDDFNAEELAEEGMEKHDIYLENVEYGEDGEPLMDIEEFFESEEDKVKNREKEAELGDQ